MMKNSCWYLTQSLPKLTKVDSVKLCKSASVNLSQPMLNLYKHTTYTMRAQRIFVQQKTLKFYSQGHFVFMGEYFLHNNFLQIMARKIADFLKQPMAFLPSHIFKQLSVNVLTVTSTYTQFHSKQFLFKT
jgi:hypothetical protein